MKPFAVRSIDDHRWSAQGTCTDDGEDLYIEIQRPGIPSVLREMRRNKARRGKSIQGIKGLLPSFVSGNQTILAIGLSRRSALNLAAVLDGLLKEK